MLFSFNTKVKVELLVDSSIDNF